jgi:hypothetical protein
LRERNDRFGPTGKLAAGQHHAVTTSAAFQTNIRAQAGDIPIMPSARVWFAHSYDVVQLQVR